MDFSLLLAGNCIDVVGFFLCWQLKEEAKFNPWHSKLGKVWSSEGSVLYNYWLVDWLAKDIFLWVLL